MNFYDYYQPGEQLDDSPAHLAAIDIIKAGMQVIPLKKGEKEPANIRNVHGLVANPIHLENIIYYFGEGRDVDIGIILSDDMEFIDVDGKQKPGLLNDFLTSLEQAWPELYEKLVQDNTPNDGCHLIYRSEVVGGKSALAKKHSQYQPVTLIERINKFNGKQYIKCSPSQGYILKRGNPLELPFLTAEERNWLGAFASSFNEVIIPEVKKLDVVREDSPWNVFNTKKDWSYILDELKQRNWTVHLDLPNKVTVRRPGNTSQTHSAVIYKDNNTLFLFTTSSEFEDGKAYTPFGVYALLYHENNVAAASRQLASEGIGTNITIEGQFWRKVGKRIVVKYTELLNYLHAIGYRVYNKTLVQVVDNKVRLVHEDDLKRVFLNEVEFEMVDHFYEKVSTIFSESGGLMAMINELQGEFIRDDKFYTWLFFKNVAVKVSGEQIQHIAYEKLTGYIWESEIIDKEFYTCEYEGCDAERFVGILGGARADNLKKILGYTISRYKDSLNPRAVVLMEDIDPEQEGESQGGSGKGLLFSFCRYFRKTVDFDGKSFRPTDPFLYQNVTPDTSILFIDDVEKNFKFSYLYSILTGALQVNRKNKDQFIMAFEDSPKVVLTSNYSVGEMDQSSQRRKHEFAIIKFFGLDRSPVDEFGRQFFVDWDGLEYGKFFNFMAHCCQLYLSEADSKGIGNVTDNSLERNLISNTNREFVDYMDGQLKMNFFDFAPNHFKTATVKVDGMIVTNAVDVEKWKDSKQDDPDNYLLKGKTELLEKITALTNYRKLTPTKLTQWMKLWSQRRGVVMDFSYRKSMESTRYYRVWEFPVSGEKTETPKSEQKWQSGMEEFEGF